MAAGSADPSASIKTGGSGLPDGKEQRVERPGRAVGMAERRAQNDNEGEGGRGVPPSPG
jgi:hypothetical protein